MRWLRNSALLRRRVAEALELQRRLSGAEWRDIYAGAVATACRGHGAATCPRAAVGQAGWPSAQLRGAADRLGQFQLNETMVQETQSWLAAMRPGHEEDHLRALIRAADHGGSDARLRASEVPRSSRRSAPPVPHFAGGGGQCPVAPDAALGTTTL